LGFTSPNPFSGLASALNWTAVDDIDNCVDNPAPEIYEDPFERA
jgi:hypothetical protein